MTASDSFPQLWELFLVFPAFFFLHVVGPTLCPRLKLLDDLVPVSTSKNK